MTPPWIFDIICASNNEIYSEKLTPFEGIWLQKEKNMVKHMIIWKFKDEVENKAQKAAAIKAALEGLVGKIEGLLEMYIYTVGLPSSAGDLCMDSTFESAEALAFYAKHPLHVEVADGLVRPYMAQRLSFDFTA